MFCVLLLLLILQYCNVVGWVTGRAYKKPVTAAISRASNLEIRLKSGLYHDGHSNENVKN